MLEVQNLTKSFGGLLAVNKVNMKIEKGTICGLIGPNGSGKTTLLNMVAGFYTPTEGKVKFKGEDITGKKPFEVTQKGFARSFQNINLFSEISVLDNVMAGRFFHMNSNLFEVSLNLPSFVKEEKNGREKAREVLNFVGLGKYEEHKAGNLPYGQQRLLEIARALATEPNFLFLDEPVAGMNDRETNEVQKLLKKLSEKGLTILVIEHHMRFVMNLCKKITVLGSGEVIAEGTPNEIQNNDKVVEVYLGRRDSNAS